VCWPASPWTALELSAGLAISISRRARILYLNAGLRVKGNPWSREPGGILATGQLGNLAIGGEGTLERRAGYGSWQLADCSGQLGGVEKSIGRVVNLGRDEQSA